MYSATRLTVIALSVVNLFSPLGDIPATESNCCAISWLDLSERLSDDYGLLVDFDSQQGRDLLLSATDVGDFWSLNQHMLTQERKNHCGVATGVVTLNSMGIKHPNKQIHFRRYITQDAFFTEPVQQVISQEEVFEVGMIPDQLAAALRTYGVDAEVHIGESVDEMRHNIVDALNDPDARVIINYYRPAVDQPGAGHFSPIATYNEAVDAFLIMDVSRYKHTPLWVNADQLHEACADPRGYIIVRRIPSLLP